METQSPVVQIRDIGSLSPQLLQQAPSRAIWQRFGPLGREGEPERALLSHAHVAVWTVGDVLHQPVHTAHGEVVDMERRACVMA